MALQSNVNRPCRPGNVHSSFYDIATTTSSYGDGNLQLEGSPTDATSAPPFHFARFTLPALPSGVAAIEDDTNASDLFHADCQSNGQDRNKKNQMTSIIWILEKALDIAQTKT